MRRKRLQHAADNLCQMLCGWRQIFSKPRLLELGTGRLEIDALGGACRFNGAPIDPLPVVAELVDWLAKDLEQHDIPKHALLEATIYAVMRFDSIPWDPASDGQFFIKGEPVRSGPMHRCVMKCTSLLRTDEREYRGEFNDIEQWPVGWPAA
jgi:hypothetical protein